MRYLFLSVFAIFGSIFLISFSNKTDVVSPPANDQSIYSKDNPWVDSIMATLTLDQKIGQLFMVAAYSNMGSSHRDEIEKLITEQEVGGLIFMQGGPIREIDQYNRYQSISNIPLLVAMDAEWGPGMRLDSTIVYPRQMTLGAVNDETLVYNFGREVGRQLKRIGVHVNFAPVVDINNNASNPVIGNRSFGEMRELVSRYGLAYTKGLQDEGVMACGKHFPGHGDTDVDSHKELPIIPHDRARLDSIELYPFKKLVDAGIGSMMIAHLYMPKIDSTHLQPSTLSEKIVTGILREDLGFDGLIFTDAMTMQGIAKYFEAGEMDVKALQAGNDMLLFPADVPVAIEKIKQALDSGQLTMDQIECKCRRILQAKQWVGLDKYRPISRRNVIADLNSPYAEALEREIVAQAITTIKNTSPIQLWKSDTLKIATLSFGEDEKNAFNDELANFAIFDRYAVDYRPSFSTIKKYVADLSEYDLVIINWLNTSNKASKNYNLTEQASGLVNEIAQKTQVFLNVFANPYGLASIPFPNKAQMVNIAYQDTKVTQRAVANYLAGAGGGGGQLPVSISEKYPAGCGLKPFSPVRLGFTTPESIGIDPSYLQRIDSIAMAGIKAQAYPGCRVLVAKDGQIFYDKGFGNQTYEAKIPVDQNTVYDIASITKIVSSTAALMKLQDEGLVNVDYNLCDYLDICDTSEYYNLNLREMLSHYARLRSWIPFYLETISDGNLDPRIYSETKKDGYSVQVADNLFILDAYRDSMLNEIYNTPLSDQQKYKYSDLGYYFIQKIVEQKTGLSLDQYVAENFYKPMGLTSIGYLPLERMDISRIAPTEYDLLFRKQLVHGHVHDPGAAMTGGVGGHAGIFSTAYDLAVMMQMFMDRGYYGGRQYITPETIDYFTDCHYCEDGNRRGIGFDKPTSALDSGPTCNQATPESFGHSGFTGTITWADPVHGIVYVFLSNRVYPNADNSKLLKMNIRTDIQEVIYAALNIPNRIATDHLTTNQNIK
jgi:beta-N-acetylhexosaminidase